MAFGRPHVVVQTFDDKFLLVGMQHGAEVTGGTMVTGTAMGICRGTLWNLQRMRLLRQIS